MKLADALLLFFISFHLFGAAQAQQGTFHPINTVYLGQEDFLTLLILHGIDRGEIGNFIKKDTSAANPFEADKKFDAFLDNVYELAKAPSTIIKQSRDINGNYILATENWSKLKFVYNSLTFTFCLPTSVGSTVGPATRPYETGVAINLDYGGLFSGLAGICVGNTDWNVGRNASRADNFVRISLHDNREIAEKIWNGFNDSNTDTKWVRSVAYCKNIRTFRGVAECDVYRVDLTPITVSSYQEGVVLSLIKSADGNWSWQRP
tara:strand:- start:4641 stop:5429 length:789 start_codon:yes stop_codon:yes gene_type:complete